jgi:uncharacterized membrane protein YedE/YeeE
MRVSIGTGLALIAVGAILALAVQAPAAVEEYVDVLDLGLILVWTGVLVLVMVAYLHLPRRAPAPTRPAARVAPYEDPWDTRDVHRAGYEGRTQELPTVRGDRDRRG